MGWFIFSRKKRVYISLYNFQDFEYPLPCRAKGKKDSGASLKRFVPLTSLKLIKLITSPTSRYLLSGKKETIRPSPRDWSTVLNNTLLPAISIDIPRPRERRKIKNSPPVSLSQSRFSLFSIQKNTCPADSYGFRRRARSSTFTARANLIYRPISYVCRLVTTLNFLRGVQLPAWLRNSSWVTSLPSKAFSSFPTFGP